MTIQNMNIESLFAGGSSVQIMNALTPILPKPTSDSNDNTYAIHCERAQCAMTGLLDILTTLRDKYGTTISLTDIIKYCDVRHFKALINRDDQKIDSVCFKSFYDLPGWDEDREPGYQRENCYSQLGFSFMFWIRALKRLDETINKSLGTI